jgi:hypothetical protein
MAMAQKARFADGDDDDDINRQILFPHPITL